MNTHCAGRQYLSIGNIERLDDVGISVSVGTNGDSYDKVLAKTIIGFYKTKVIHHRGPWKGREAVEPVTLEWVDWLKNRRLLEPIGNVLPNGKNGKLSAKVLPQSGLTQAEAVS